MAPGKRPKKVTARLPPPRSSISPDTEPLEPTTSAPEPDALVEDAMDALRARGPARSKEEIEAEKAQKLAAAHARAELKKKRDKAGEELAVYENAVAAEAEANQHIADHPPLPRVMPQRAARRQAVEKTSGQDTHGETNNDFGEAPQHFDSPASSQEFVPDDPNEEDESESEEELLAAKTSKMSKKATGAGGGAESRGRQRINGMRAEGQGAGEKRAPSAGDEPPAKRSKPPTVSGLVSDWNPDIGHRNSLKQIPSRSLSPATVPPLSDGDNLDSSDDGGMGIQMGRGFGDEMDEVEAFQPTDSGGVGKYNVPMLSWNFVHSGVSVQKTTTISKPHRPLPAPSRAQNDIADAREQTADPRNTDVEDDSFVSQHKPTTRTMSAPSAPSVSTPEMPLALTKITFKNRAAPVAAASASKSAKVTVGTPHSERTSIGKSSSKASASGAAQKSFKMSHVPSDIRKPFEHIVLPAAKKFTASLGAFARPSVKELEELMNMNIDGQNFKLTEDSLYTKLIFKRLREWRSTFASSALQGMTILLPRIAQALKAMDRPHDAGAVAEQVKTSLGHENDQDRPFWWSEWAPDGPKKGRFQSPLILFTFATHLQAVSSIGGYDMDEDAPPIGALIMSVLAAERALKACSTGELVLPDSRSSDGWFSADNFRDGERWVDGQKIEITRLGRLTSYVKKLSSAHWCAIIEAAETTRTAMEQASSGSQRKGKRSRAAASASSDAEKSGYISDGYELVSD